MAVHNSLRPSGMREAREQADCDPSSCEGTPICSPYSIPRSSNGRIGPERSGDCNQCDNPFYDMLCGRVSTECIWDLRSLVAQLSGASSVTLGKLRHGMSRDVSVEEVRNMLSQHPKLVKLFRKSGRDTAQLLWPNVHDRRCPHFGLSRAAAKRQRCLCALLA
eukprot:11049685-Karenia_brevis.AAC.1